jgi:Ca2+-binding EF-hand superfamily protein
MAEQASSPAVRAIPAGSIPKASLSEKPPAKLNVKPVQLSLNPRVSSSSSAGDVAPAPAANGTSQPPSIGQPLAMPKIEPVKPLSGGGMKPSLGAVAQEPTADATEDNALPAKTFSAPENDAALQRLKELRKVCVLSEIPVQTALDAFSAAAGSKKTPKPDEQTDEQSSSPLKDQELNLATFQQQYAELCESQGKKPPSAQVMRDVFLLFDKDQNGTIDMMELCSGISMMCAGTEDEKIAAVFGSFDTDGDGFISPEEMYVFLSSVFKVVLTDSVLASLRDCGVEIEGAEDLANVTTSECFKQADADGDGQLTIEEFKSWFYAPRNDPAFMFAPMRTLLE